MSLNDNFLKGEFNYQVDIPALAHHAERLRLTKIIENKIRIIQEQWNENLRLNDAKCRCAENRTDRCNRNNKHTEVVLDGIPRKIYRLAK